MANPLQVTFAGGDVGAWRIQSIEPYRGESLPGAARLAVLDGHVSPPGAAWALRGSTSNHRYITRDEKLALAARQEGLGRPQATCASLIPIKKSDAWWELAQDERRRIFEESSRHVAGTLEFLPAIARRLHHCRELGEPFDFLTWFEYAPADAARFDELLARLRATEEWRFVEREAHVRLSR